MGRNDGSIHIVVRTGCRKESRNGRISGRSAIGINSCNSDIGRSGNYRSSLVGDRNGGRCRACVACAIGGTEGQRSNAQRQRGWSVMGWNQRTADKIGRTRTSQEGGNRCIGGRSACCIHCCYGNARRSGNRRQSGILYGDTLIAGCRVAVGIGNRPSNSGNANREGSWSIAGWNQSAIYQIRSRSCTNGNRGLWAGGLYRYIGWQCQRRCRGIGNHNILNRRGAVAVGVGDTPSHLRSANREAGRGIVGSEQYAIDNIAGSGIA